MSLRITKKEAETLERIAVTLGADATAAATEATIRHTLRRAGIDGDPSDYVRNGGRIIRRAPLSRPVMAGLAVLFTLSTLAAPASPQTWTMPEMPPAYADAVVRHVAPGGPRDTHGVDDHAPPFPDLRGLHVWTKLGGARNLSMVYLTAGCSGGSLSIGVETAVENFEWLDALHGNPGKTGVLRSPGFAPISREQARQILAWAAYLGGLGEPVNVVRLKINMERGDRLGGAWAARGGEIEHAVVGDCVAVEVVP